MKRKLEHRDFILATKDQATIVSLDYIGMNLNEYIDLIVEADRQDKTFISVLDHESIIEIQWEYKWIEKN